MKGQSCWSVVPSQYFQLLLALSTGCLRVFLPQSGASLEVVNRYHFLLSKPSYYSEFVCNFRIKNRQDIYLSTKHWSTENPLAGVWAFDEMESKGKIGEIISE